MEHNEDTEKKTEEEIAQLEKQVRHLQEKIHHLKKKSKIRNYATATTASISGLTSTTQRKREPEATIPLISTYKKRSGTVDYGKEFEYLMCGFYALKFSIDDNVKDFEMTSNNKIYGDFDDVALKITFIDGSVKNYLIQLKHSENTREIVRKSELESSTGGFGINKYLKSFEQVKNLENVICILFTNRGVGFPKELSVNNHKISANSLNDTHLLDTSDRNNSVFYFEIQEQRSEELEEFFKKFYLFTSQKNVKKVESSIKEIINNLLGCEIDFIKFMQHWWKGNFVLTKHDVISKLVELALSPFILEITNEEEIANLCEKTAILKNLIENFEMTIVKGDDGGLVQKFWSTNFLKSQEISIASLKYGLTKQGIQDVDSLSLKEKSKILWYLNKAPLIIKFDKVHYRQIENTINLLEVSKQGKKVVIFGNITKEDFPNWKIFENLSDLSDEYFYLEILKSFKISLQGRPCISLEQLIDCNPNTNNVIETRELLLMSQEDIRIGQKEENLPETYIPRKVSTKILNTEEVLKNYDGETDLLVINCEETLKDVVQMRSARVVELREYFTQLRPDEDQFTNLIIMAVKNKCTKADYREICKKTNKNVYLLQIIDKENCIMVSDNDRKYFEGPPLEESEIHEVLNDPINVICARPGLGKSTMMTYLSSFCPSDNWSVRVNLIKYNSFFKRKPSNEQILSYFLQDDDQFLWKIKSFFKESKKIYLFLDGLDEIDSECIPLVLEYVKHAASNDLHVWLSSRENLKEMITDYLNTFSVDIEELNEEQQKTYICERLSVTDEFTNQQYKKEEIAMIAKTIFTSVSIISNSRNLLGVPLQLYIITEIFRLDRKNYQQLNEGTFVLTKMYKLFFEGKKAHQDEKAKIENKTAIDDTFYYSLKQFEIPALESTLDSETFDKLIPRDSRELKESRLFLKKMKSEGNKLGIVNQVIREGNSLRAIFVHQTYAEYFACVWLKHSQDKLRMLKEDFFSKKYQSLRLIFDIMLAEERPLHLATIYKNPDQVLKNLHSYEDTDEGGRTPLHLICSYGAKWSEVSFEEYTVKEMRESSSYERIFEDLLGCDNLNPFQKDELFQMDSLEYSLRAHCLYPFEAILKVYGKEVNLGLLKQLNIYNLAIYSVYLGYSKLLKSLIMRDSNIIQLRIGSHGKSLLHVCVEGSANDNRKQLETIEILVHSGIGVDVTDQSEDTALHVASETKNCSLVEKLIDSGADTNATNYRLYTALHCAARNNEFGRDIIQLLLQKGAKLNATDKDGYTPLHIACASGNSNIVEILLENGADCNGMAEGQYSVLDCAARNITFGKDIINLLVEKGVTINLQNKNECSVLHLACVFGNYGVVKTLLKLDSEMSDFDRYNILLSVVRNKAFDHDVIKLLVNKGANINATDIHGYSVLHLTCGYGKLIAVEAVIECGGDINAVTTNSSTVLHCAAQNLGFGKEVIPFLIEKGADIDARDVNGYSILHAACRSGSYDTVNTLLNHGADINATTTNQETVLHCAAKNTEFGRNIVKLLVEKKADINATDKFGHSVLHTACQFGNRDLVKAIIQCGARHSTYSNTGENILHCAARNGGFGQDIIRMLHGKFNINEKNANGYSALQIAAHYGNCATVNAIIESGGDVHVISDTKETILHFAVQNHTSGKDIIDLLAAKGANINAVNDYGYSVLHAACQFGSYDIVNALLHYGSASSTSNSAKTELNCAALNGTFCAKIIKLLVENGANINEKNENGYSVLHIAAEYGTTKAVRAILDSGGDVDAISNSGDSILHCAAVNHKFGKGVIKVLANQTNINAVNRNGYTALHVACAYGNCDVVKTILEIGGDINATTHKQYGVLHCAAQNKEFGEDIIRLLIENGATINATDGNGYSVLHVACQFGNCNIVNAILARVGNIYVVSNNGDTPLHCAVINKTHGKDIMKLLIDRGANVNSVNEYGHSVLHVVSQFGNCDTVKVVIDNGAFLNAVSTIGETVLHCAAQNCNFGKDIVKLLVEYGVNINATDNDGHNALHIACQFGNYDTVTTILEYDGDVSAISTVDKHTMLHCAVKNQFTSDIVKLLIELGLNINAKAKMKYSPLHIACEHGTFETVQILIENGANVNALSESKYSVLHCAVQNRDFGEDITNLLICNGANMYATDSNGFSVLHAACQLGNYGVVATLIENGADIRAVTDTRFNALHYAALNRECGTDIGKLLIDYGVNLRAKNIFGLNAVETAISFGNNEVAEAFIDYGGNALIDEEAACCNMF